MDLTLGYNKKQDRIWLKAGDKLYWLTRRLVRQLIGPTAEILEKTVPGGEIPNAFPASERVRIDHGEAIGESLDGAPGIRSNVERLAEDDLMRGALLISLSLSLKDHQWRLELKDHSQTTTFNLNRLDMHRLLGALMHVIREAKWDLSEIPQWLDGLTD
jgi:hypothetical protein